MTFSFLIPSHLVSIFHTVVSVFPSFAALIRLPFITLSSFAHF